MASYPSIHMRRAAHLLATTPREDVEHADQEFKFHAYEAPVIAGIQQRGEYEESSTVAGMKLGASVSVTPRNEKVMNGKAWGQAILKNVAGPRMSRMDVFAEQAHGQRRDAIGGSAIQSTEIRRSAGRDYDGEKNGGKTDKLADDMRKRIDTQYGLLHDKSRRA